jgi:hypothetical protein
LCVCFPLTRLLPTSWNHRGVLERKITGQRLGHCFSFA